MSFQLSRLAHREQRNKESRPTGTLKSIFNKTFERPTITRRIQTIGLVIRTFGSSAATT